MRRRAGVALLAALLLVAGCSGGGGAESHYRFRSATTLGALIPGADRKPAGQFTDHTLAGGTFSLAKQTGKVVVVNFWATWCPPCIVELPQFDQVYRQHKDRPVAFVGIDMKDHPSARGSAFVREYHISYPSIYDEKGETALRIGEIPTLSLPFTVLIDKQQRVAAVYLNAMTAEDLTPVLDRLLGE